MNKTAKTFRLSQETLKQLKELSQLLGISETEVVSRAIHFYYISLKGEEKSIEGGPIVPFSEYKKAQEQLKQAIYKIGQLEGQLKVKEELIEELKQRIKELQGKQSRKWWQFWKI